MRPLPYRNQSGIKGLKTDAEFRSEFRRRNYDR